MPVEDFTYYGRMEDVIVLNYRYDCRVVLFKCIWYGDKHDARRLVHNDKTTGETSAFTAKQWFTEEPYILAIQAKQVFYIKDLVLGGNWEIVQECNCCRSFSENPRRQEDTPFKGPMVRLEVLKNGKPSVTSRLTSPHAKSSRSSSRASSRSPRVEPRVVPRVEPRVAPRVEP